MTSHKSTRSRRSDILAHHRSSQRAAISTPERRPARRPSHHGYGEAKGAPPPERLIPPMIERFIATDRSYAKGRRASQPG
ncbi:DUF2274 domain-containing protein [Sphingopyxis sp. 550A]